MSSPITIEETREWQPIWHIMQDPEIYDAICDDNWRALPRDSVRLVLKGIVEDVRNHSLLVVQDGICVGAFVCLNKGEGVFEVHTLLTKDCRGADAITAGKAGMAYMLNRPGVEKLTSLCPTNLPAAYLYARFCGFHKAGVSAIKRLQGGIEYPIKLVEATKLDLCHS